MYHVDTYDMMRRALLWHSSPKLNHGPVMKKQAKPNFTKSKLKVMKSKKRVKTITD
jgi:hypothetical protein